VITRLAGKLLGGDPTEVVVDVQGVGFAVSIPLSTYDKLPRAGSDVILFTHLVVREDALQLYGFATVEERRLFRLLATTVTGIGPRLALNILSAMPVKQFCQALRRTTDRGTEGTPGRHRSNRGIRRAGRRVSDGQPRGTGRHFGTGNTRIQRRAGTQHRPQTVPRTQTRGVLRRKLDPQSLEHPECVACQPI